MTGRRQSEIWGTSSESHVKRVYRSITFKLAAKRVETGRECYGKASKAMLAQSSMNLRTAMVFGNDPSSCVAVQNAHDGFSKPFLTQNWSFSQRERRPLDA